MSTIANEIGPVKPTPNRFPIGVIEPLRRANKGSQQIWSL